MTLLRRDFVRLACLVPGAASFSIGEGCGTDGPPGRVRMGPFCARPGQDRMSIWCEGEASAVSGVTLVPLPDGEAMEGRFETIGEGLYLATFEGLSADTQYAYSFRDGLDTPYDGTFCTLPRGDAVLRLAVGADIHPLSKPYDAFGAVLERLPHLFLALGDQVYADLDPSGATGTTGPAYDALYRRTWSDDSLRMCWGNVPTVLVWDDHEVWNDYDGSFGAERIDAARRAYERYQTSRNGTENPWMTLDLGPASMFVMDTRTYRAPNAAPDGPSKSMLGEAQLQALLEFIRTTTSPLALIASPTPFHVHADTGNDAWAHGFAFERGVILQAIADAGASRFVLVTGDQHWPAVVENALPGGGALLEMQCTPIAAFARTPPPSPLSSDFLFVGDGSVGFGSFEIRAESPRLKFAWVGADGVDQYTLEVP